MRKSNPNKLVFSAEAKAKLKEREPLRKELKEHKSPQEILGISDDTITHFYMTARKLFENHQFIEAADAFLFLTLINSNNHVYWLGLGMSTQMSGNFESAIDAYEMAAIHEIEDPTPYFYLAKCLFAIHERQSALQALDTAILYAGESPEYEDLKIRAIEVKNLLEKHTK